MASSLRADSKIFVAGHAGLVGSAIIRCLKRYGYSEILCRSKDELDLRKSADVQSFFERERPEFVILAAAKVGGVGANSTYPVEFLLENLQIQNNVISSAAEYGVQKLVFLGSSCIYPKNARQPLTEDQFLTGPFEPTNEAYALAKSAGVRLCEYYHRQYRKNFISLMPTNLYGPNDYYHFENSHVIPAMMLKILKAKKENRPSVTLWGTGKPLREFLHSDDLAEAVVACLEKYDDPSLINIGSGLEISIFELSQLVAKVCDYRGKIEWDSTKPDGIMRKIMNSEKISQMGWRAKISLEEGLRGIVHEAERKLS
jgi:GDP-L-fucose synthase